MTSNDRPTPKESRPSVGVPISTLASLPSSSPQDVSERILKKRESDRRCQRIKRERTKSKIAALEEKVRTLAEEDRTGQVQLLMRQLQEVEKQRDLLAKKVKTIESVIFEDASGEKQHKRAVSEQDNSDFADVCLSAVNLRGSEDVGRNGDNDFTEQENWCRGHEHNAMELTNGLDQNHESAVVSHDSPALNTSSVVVDGTPGTYLPDIVPSTSVHGCSAHVQQNQPCECCSTETAVSGKPRFNTWRYVNEMLGSRFEWPVYFQLLQDTYRADTPVRVVVEGWESIEARGPMHPSWQILKQIDQVLFARCGPKERLAVMYATQLLLMSHTTSESPPELPDFYRKRPSQNMADSYAIHFFPWPGMRERFVFNQHRYCSNDFWYTFIHGLHVLWPYEFRDCYTRNVETGLYSISPLFQERVNDIKSWTMSSDVFQKWPELRTDIPVYNSIPRSMSTTTKHCRRQQPVFRAATHFDDGFESLVESLPLQQHALSSQVYTVRDAIPAASSFPTSARYSAGRKNIMGFRWAGHAPQHIREGSAFFVPTITSSNGNSSLSG